MGKDCLQSLLFICGRVLEVEQHHCVCRKQCSTQKQSKPLCCSTSRFSVVLIRGQSHAQHKPRTAKPTAIHCCLFRTITEVMLVYETIPVSQIRIFHGDVVCLYSLHVSVHLQPHTDDYYPILPFAHYCSN